MNELDIKVKVLDYFKKYNAGAIYGSEVRFEFATRRADLVLIEGGLTTAFEIKSARDNVLRLEEQIESYKKYFDFCYVVCEEQNIKSIRAVLNKNIGIIVVSSDSIQWIRKAKHYKKHDKYSLASTISVQNYKKHFNFNAKLSHYELCKSLVKSSTLEQVRDISRHFLSIRYQLPTALFKIETNEAQITADDIRTITYGSPTLLTKIDEAYTECTDR